MSTIRAASQLEQWRYTNSSLNRADCASRGVSVHNFLKTETWISGPEFLRQDESDWPKAPVLTLAVGDPEVKVLTVNVTAIEGNDSINRIILRYSKWHHLKRAVAWILRIKAALRMAVAKKKGLLGNKKIKQTNLTHNLSLWKTSRKLKWLSFSFVSKHVLQMR